MSRNLTNEVIKDIYATTTSSVDLIVIRVTSGLDTMYFVRNNEDITYDGQLYTSAPFDVTLPDDKETESTSAALTIMDVGGDIYSTVRTYNEMFLEFELINYQPATDTYVSISLYPNFKLSNAQWNYSTVTLSMIRDDATMYNFPKDSMDNILFPNLY